MSGRASVKLFLCGDVMTGRGIDQILPHSCPPHLREPYVTSALTYVALAERAYGPIPRHVGFGYVWREALAVVEEQQPQARIVNLETSVTTSEDIEHKPVTYRMHPGNAPVLTTARIDCCVLANNHVGDWGEAGLLETLDTLAAAGLRVAGAGRDLAEAQAPASVPVAEETRVLVFAFGAPDCGIPEDWGARAAKPGIHLLPDLSEQTAGRIASLVEQARPRPGDVIVASVHWGSNWGYHVPEAHRRFAHALIDRAQVDVVHGHSSHHRKAIEVHRGRPILYGCGEFVNDYEGIRGHEAFRGDLVLMYFPTIDVDSRRLVELRMIPLQIRNFQLVRPSRADRVWLCGVLDRECRQFGGRVTERDDAFVLTGD